MHKNKSLMLGSGRGDVGGGEKYLEISYAAPHHF